MYNICVTVCTFLFVGIYADTSTRINTLPHEYILKDAQPVGNKLRRFILADHLQHNWSSWEQRVACLTTCVQGYEEETVACCSTGDNRLCFDLPWILLNNSVGNCKDFCQRKDQISCKMSPSAICGSDGKIYENRCEFTKAICTQSGLISKEMKYCKDSGLTSSTFSPIISTGIRKQSTASAAPGPISTSHTTFANVSKSSTVSTGTFSLTTGIKSTLQSSSTVHTVSTTTTGVSTTTFAPTVPAYCQNKNSISCGFTFNIVCGSDRKYYANQCMLALGRCDNPSLTLKDKHYCASGR